MRNRNPQTSELKEMRIRYGIKTTSLSDAALIDRSRLCVLENGKCRFTSASLRKLINGYEKLGFKQAKFALYDIFKRANPIVEPEPPAYEREAIPAESRLQC